MMRSSFLAVLNNGKQYFVVYTKPILHFFTSAKTCKICLLSRFQSPGKVRI